MIPNMIATRHGIGMSLLLVVSCAAAAAPNLNGGTWQAINPAQTLMTVDGKPPPLLPDAQAVYEKHRAARKAGDASFDTTEHCLPPGLPRVLYMPGYSFEFLQRPEQIAIHYQWNRLLRLVDMDIPQPDLIAPTYLGQSVGKWQGDTLVVDSIGFIDTTLLDAAGLPHSDALHVIERYTPSSDGKRMTVRITIEDPKTYVKPWEIKLNLKHNPQGQIQEDMCLQRKHINWGKFEDAPGGSSKDSDKAPSKEGNR